MEESSLKLNWKVSDLVLRFLVLIWENCQMWELQVASCKLSCREFHYNRAS